MKKNISFKKRTGSDCMDITMTWSSHLTLPYLALVFLKHEETVDLCPNPKLLVFLNNLVTQPGLGFMRTDRRAGVFFVADRVSSIYHIIFFHDSW